MGTRHILLFVLAAATLGAPAGGRDIYVSPAGTNIYPFTNWPDAATNIEWAVNAGVNGDVVWISNGTYYLTNQITVMSNITIRGVNENNLPVIDGNNSCRCFEFVLGKTGTLANLFIANGTAFSNGAGVVMRSGEVRDCVFSNNACPTNNGGGMYVEPGSVGTSTVLRCTFIANFATNGGGLFIARFGKTIVDDCWFHTNIAVLSGGGIYDAEQGSATIITGCVFTCNVASNLGGGVYFYGTMTHSTLASNVAYEGGGVYCRGLLTNCYISNNIATNLNGGGIYVAAGVGVKNCVIARNKTLRFVSNDGGGGIYVGAGTTVIIQDCIIEENTTVSCGGGAYLNSGTVRNCLIRNNSAAGARGGGGIRIGTAGPVISGCTIVSNHATGGAGGGIHNRAAVSYDNCITYFNDSSGTDSNYYSSGPSLVSFSNCCLAPELPGTYATNSANNITNSPQFVSSDTGNYRLSNGSPCVNAGVTQDWMNSASDLDGRRRVDKFSGAADIGCYEYVPNGLMFRAQ